MRRFSLIVLLLAALWLCAAHRAGAQVQLTETVGDAFQLTLSGAYDFSAVDSAGFGLYSTSGRLLAGPYGCSSDQVTCADGSLTILLDATATEYWSLPPSHTQPYTYNLAVEPSGASAPETWLGGPFVLGPRGTDPGTVIDELSVTVTTGGTAVALTLSETGIAYTVAGSYWQGLSAISPASGDSLLIISEGSLGAFGWDELPSGGGGAIDLDLGNDNGFESTALKGIETQNDPGPVFSEPTADTLRFDGTSLLYEAELDSEAELETQLVGVTDVFTNNDGALDDDDLSDDPLSALADVSVTAPADAHILIRDQTTDTRWENVALSGDVTLSVTGAATVGDDSHSHTGSTISALDAADVTTGAFADARVDGSLEEDEINHDNLIGFVAGEHIDWTLASQGTIHATNYVDSDTQLSQEQVEDFAGAMVSGNTETGIAVTYQDIDGTLDFVAEVTQSEFDTHTGNASAHHTATVDTGPVADCTGTDGQLADGSCADLALQSELDAEVLSTSSAGLDVSDHVVDLDVTPSAGSATLVQAEDALQVKYGSTLTEGVSGLDVADVSGVTGADEDDVTLADVQAATSSDFHNIGGTDDDVPESGDFGAASDLDGAGDIVADAVGTAELDDDANSPAAGDFVTVEVGAASFDYVTPNAGTDITADLEEEAHAAEHQSGGADEMSLAGLTVDDDDVAFDDAGSDYAATTIGAAVEELVSVNVSGVNAADGKVEWSQLVGVPAGFADGSDDGAGGSAGTVNTIKEAGVQVGGSDIVTIDFGAGFDVAETPDTEVNVTLDYTEDPVDLSGSEVTGTLADGSVDGSLEEDEINHDNLTGFVADEHVAHSGVTLTAGTGLSGGGTIAANRSFSVDQSFAPTWTGVHTFQDSVIVSTGLRAAVTGSDPVISFSDGVVNVSRGELQEGGSPVFTAADGALADDDVSDDNLGALADVNVAAPADAHILVRDQTTDVRWENVAMSGDATISVTGAVTVADNSHSHTESNISDLDHLTATEAHDALVENGTDELLGETLGTACTENQILKANATGGLDCAADATGAGGSALATEVDGVQQSADTKVYDWDDSFFAITEPVADEFGVSLDDVFVTNSADDTMAGDLTLDDDDAGTALTVRADAAGDAAGTPNVGLLITTDDDDDTDYVPLEIRDDSGVGNDLLLSVGSDGQVDINTSVANSRFADAGALNIDVAPAGGIRVQGPEAVFVLADTDENPEFILRNTTTGTTLQVQSGIDLVSESGGWAIDDTTPSAYLDVGGGTATTIDGVNDLLVADDAEIDGDLYVEGVLDFATSGGRMILPNSTTLPATCTLGEPYWDTDADTNGSLYVCNSGSNTWKEVDDDGGAGGSVTVEEADAAPSVASVSTIQFDQADGFTVTDETGGQVQIDLAAVPNSVLANSSVSYGGVAVALGASDATPAFDLVDATNYPFSSLTGTADAVGAAEIDETDSYTWTGTHQFDGDVGIGTAPSHLVDISYSGDASKNVINIAQTIGGSSGISGVYRPFNYQTNITATDLLDTDLITTGLRHGVLYGQGGAATVGIAHGLSVGFVVEGNGDADNEHAAYFGEMRYEIGTGFTQTVGPVGRAYFADYKLHGPIAVQPDALNGHVFFMNNYFDGAPVDSPSGAMWITTRQGTGTTEAAFTSADTYPIDVGLGIVGYSEASTVVDVGFNTALQIGGTGSPRCTAGCTTRIGTGIDISDHATYGIHIHDRYSGGTAPALVVASGAGNVGIGRTDPAYPLDVVGSPVTGRFLSSGVRAKVYIENSAADGDMMLTFLNAGVQAWTIGQDDGDGDSFKIMPSESTDWTGAIVEITTGGDVLLSASPAADDNDLSVATTAYVQGEINGSGGRSLTASSGTLDADAELYTHTTNPVIISPADYTNGYVQFDLGAGAATITRIVCSTDVGTADIQLDERDEETPTTAGTDVLSSALQCTTTPETDTCAETDGCADAFANAAIAAGNILSLDIDATASSPGVVRIHLEYTKDD